MVELPYCAIEFAAICARGFDAIPGAITFAASVRSGAIQGFCVVGCSCFFDAVGGGGGGGGALETFLVLSLRGAGRRTGLGELFQLLLLLFQELLFVGGDCAVFVVVVVQELSLFHPELEDAFQLLLLPLLHPESLLPPHPPLLLLLLFPC